MSCLARVLALAQTMADGDPGTPQPRSKHVGWEVDEGEGGEDEGAMTIGDLDDEFGDAASRLEAPLTPQAAVCGRGSALGAERGEGGGQRPAGCSERGQLQQ